MISNYFPKKSPASIICTFGLSCNTSLSFIDDATNIFSSRSVSQANLSKKFNFFNCFFPHLLVPGPEVNQDFFHRTQSIRIAKSYNEYYSKGSTTILLSVE